MATRRTGDQDITTTGDMAVSLNIPHFPKFDLDDFTTIVTNIYKIYKLSIVGFVYDITGRFPLMWIGRTGPYTHYW